MSSLQFESYVFDPRPLYPLLVTAKHYSHPSLCPQDPKALTLIFAHGTGFHKEQWEPTFEHLCDILHTYDKSVKLREIWSLDCPNHGDAAILNERELEWGYSQVFGWEDYARSIHAFLRGLGTGIPVDFTTRRLVGVGHSMGAIALMLSTTYAPSIEYSSILLVEPMLLPPPPPGEAKPNILAEGAKKRRDIWPSRAVALETLQSRASFKIWDPRVLQTFIEHGFRELPTTTYPDQQGVTLKCTRIQEVACYNDGLGRTRAYKYLPALCSRIPVHFIYGAINEVYSTDETKAEVLNVAAQGKYASVARVAGAGHLVVQMQPQNLAHAIHAALKTDASSQNATSKL